MDAQEVIFIITKNIGPKKKLNKHEILFWMIYIIKSHNIQVHLHLRMCCIQILYNRNSFGFDNALLLTET